MKVARGEKHECYACGKAHWIDCHTNFGVSQPCLTLVTSGEVPCPRCTEPVETMGYVALWLAWNTKPMFALVHHDQRERVDALHRGQPVWVGRDDHKTAGIYVISRLGTKVSMLKLDRPALVATVDLLPTLLKVWKLPQLAAWAQCQSAVSDNAVSLTKEGSVEVKRECLDPTTKPAPNATGEYVPPEDARRKGTDDALKRTLGKAKLFEPSMNGDHDAV